MTRHVIALTVQDGPVVLRSCETEREQRRAYRDALATLRDGGFDGDVVGIELGVAPKRGSQAEPGAQNFPAIGRRQSSSSPCCRAKRRKGRTA